MSFPAGEYIQQQAHAAYFRDWVTAETAQILESAV